jgi:FkbM family methyltransferase
MYRTRKTINKKLKHTRRELSSLSKHIEESVFYYYHGLSLLPDAVTKYIKDNDFIDAGAFIGDSAIALKDFQYKKIYSLEISQKSIKSYKFNLARYNVSTDKFEIINVSIASNNDGTPVKLLDTGSSGLSILRKSGKYDEISVEQKTVDYIVDKYKISPRFIKVDIEGNGLEFVKGAKETLTKFRPVLSIAIYHNPYEFFEVKPLLERLLDDYVFLIRKLTAGIKNNLCHSEVVLMGYPKEIIK